MQRYLLVNARQRLGCADPRTLLLGWHMLRRVLASREQQHSVWQEEVEMGLTQVRICNTRFSRAGQPLPNKLFPVWHKRGSHR